MNICFRSILHEVCADLAQDSYVHKRKIFAHFFDIGLECVQIFLIFEHDP